MTRSLRIVCCGLDWTTFGRGWTHSHMTSQLDTPASSADAVPFPPSEQRITRLRDLSPSQWKSGIAAWLGWLFDGLDMHLYTLVAVPFVSQLIAVSRRTIAASQRTAPTFRRLS